MKQTCNRRSNEYPVKALEVEAGLALRDIDLSPAGLDDLIMRIRGDGIAISDGLPVPGLRSIAAPITNWQNEAEAIVTLISTSETLLAPESVARTDLKSFVRKFSFTRNVRDFRGRFRLGAK